MFAKCDRICENVHSSHKTKCGDKWTNKKFTFISLLTLIHVCTRICLTRMVAKFHFDMMFTVRDTALESTSCRNGGNENNRLVTNGSICLFILSANFFLGANSL